MESDLVTTPQEVQEFVLPTNVKKNVKKIMEAVKSSLSKFPNSDKYRPKYRVQVQLPDKTAHTKTTSLLFEAAADAEELVTLGKANAIMEVMLFEGKQQTGTFVCEIPKINVRSPMIVAEGMIFRFNSLAKRYSKVILEDSTYALKSHPFGTLIKTDVSKIAERKITESYSDAEELAQ